tara:strand:+ start:644 stop:895 length:252 start_codon:yes stop_codon:yes gene_type:complete
MSKLKIRELQAASRKGDVKSMRRALRTAVKVIQATDGENQSLWAMLEELKASEVKNHQELLKNEIGDAIDRTKKMVMADIGEA